jgi:hypothetical protein
MEQGVKADPMQGVTYPGVSMVHGFLHSTQFLSRDGL